MFIKVIYSIKTLLMTFKYIIQNFSSSSIPLTNTTHSKGQQIDDFKGATESVVSCYIYSLVQFHVKLGLIEKG